MRRSGSTARKIPAKAAIRNPNNFFNRRKAITILHAVMRAIVKRARARFVGDKKGWLLRTGAAANAPFYFIHRLMPPSHMVVTPG